MGWVGLNWFGFGWVGLDGLDGIGLGWGAIGLGWGGLGFASWVGLGLLVQGCAIPQIFLGGVPVPYNPRNGQTRKNARKNRNRK